MDYHQISLVLDIGANVGQYAGRLRQAGWPGRIVSFEPLPEVHAILDAAAGGDPLWRVAPALAVGDHAGTVELHRSAESDMSSALTFRPEMAELLDSARYLGSVEVPMVRLDAVFDDYTGVQDRVFLKSDTQGCDFAVLDGAAAVLSRVIGIQLELAITPVYEGEPGWLEAIGRLDALGFAPVLFIPGYFNRRTARLLSMDGVFIRR